MCLCPSNPNQSDDCHGSTIFQNIAGSWQAKRVDLEPVSQRFSCRPGAPTRILLPECAHFLKGQTFPVAAVPEIHAPALAPAEAGQATSADDWADGHESKWGALASH